MLKGALWEVRLSWDSRAVRKRDSEDRGRVRRSLIRKKKKENGHFSVQLFCQLGGMSTWWFLISPWSRSSIQKVESAKYLISCVGKALRRDVQERVTQWPGEEGTRVFQRDGGDFIKQPPSLWKILRGQSEVRTPGEQIHSNTGWETRAHAFVHSQWQVMEVPGKKN